MTPAFLLYACLVLAFRLMLLADAPVGGRMWLRKAAAEVLALALFTPQAGLLGAAAVAVVINLAGYAVERRAKERNGWRMLTGLLHLGLLSVAFAPAGGLDFRGWVAEGATHAAHWSAFGGVLPVLLERGPLLFGFGLLLAANEANLAIRWVLGRLQLKPAGEPPLDVREFNRGRVIGLLERGLIFCFVLTGQFGAIGFTLAAKGFTRFKEMENRGFAEYVLIGTLLSSSLAMAAGALVRWAQ